jgi:hypothetical protein
MDFTKTSTDQLRRSLRFHENDNGTMTMAQELRRMWLVQEIGAELDRRGTSPAERAA